MKHEWIEVYLLVKGSRNSCIAGVLAAVCLNVIIICIVYVVFPLSLGRGNGSFLSFQSLRIFYVHFLHGYPGRGNRFHVLTFQYIFHFNESVITVNRRLRYISSLAGDVITPLLQFSNTLTLTMFH